MHGEHGRRNAEHEAADDAVLERLAVVALRKAEHEDGHHERVVWAQKPFQADEQPDGHEVGNRKVQEADR